MKNILLLFAFITAFNMVKAQNVFTGIIKDNQNKPIENVYITVTKQGMPIILVYASSDSDGNYRIQYKGDADSICVNVSRLDFEKKTICIANKSQRLDFVLNHEVTQLREVVVKPSKVWRTQDTVNFSVREFTNKDDRTIADVLKRMPGIEVSPSGKISYNGEAINRFYVDDMDLMGGQYNVISKNLNNKYVETVKVYENHEPVKAMQDRNMSDQAAINLVLKDNAKAKWLASGKLGIGFEPLLWDNELTLMRFAKNIQTTFIYKNNNAGNDISTDLTAHYGLLSNISKNNLLGIPTSTPSISQTNRYLFNNAHLFTVNNLWKINKDYQLRINADYLNDYQKRDNINKTVYYLNDEEIEVNEQSHTSININKAKATLTLTGNHKKYYLLNTLNAQADWSKQRAVISDNSQFLKNPYYNVANNFTWIKVLNYNKFEIISNNRFEKMPQSLSMEPGLHEDVFNNGSPYNLLKQKSDFKNFKSENMLSYVHSKGRWSQSYSVGYKLLVQDLNSELGLPETTANHDFINKSSYIENRYYIQAKYEYTNKRINGSVSLPIGYFTLNNNDKINNLKNTDDGFYFNPRLYFKYSINSLWNVTMLASYNDSYSDIRSLYKGYMMQNYRSITKNDGSFSKIEAQNYNLRLTYHDPLKLTNVYLNMRYARNHFDYLFEQDFNGILSIRKKINYGNNTDNKSVSASFSKGFDKFIKKIIVQASYTINTANQMQQGKPAEYKHNLLTSSAILESTITAWMNVFYAFNYSNSKSGLSGTNIDVNNISINRFDYRFRLNIFPAKGLQVGVNMEYENSSAQTNLPDVFFMDANISYKFKKLEFILNYNNIFNQREYVVASYNDFYFTKNTYKLRRANILLNIRISL